MLALYQALKALDPNTFELLVVHILKAQYPGVVIQHIDGRAGDQGLDVISGQLDERPTIWQCKAFPNGIKDSQKAQVKKSLAQALKYHQPIRWVLCCNVELDSKAMRWFQRLTTSRAQDTEIRLMQASDIVDRLLYLNTIRERFFPGTVLNTELIRESLRRTSEFTTEELATLNEQNVQSYLARLQARDARFAFTVTFGRDQSVATPPAGALASLNREGVALHVFARDHDALQDRPPQVTFSVKGAGADKFLEHIRTGLPQSLSADEIKDVMSDFDFILPAERDYRSLSIRQTPMADIIPMRLTFGALKAQSVYEYVKFQLVRCGTEETLFESTSNLPYSLSLLLRNDGTGNVRLKDQCSGHNVHEAYGMTRAILSMIADEHLELYGLERNCPFMRARIPGAVPEWLQSHDLLLQEAVAVSKAYDTTLIVPDVIKRQDYLTLRWLNGLLSGITIPAEEVREFTATTSKLPDVDPTALRALAEGCSLQMVLPEFPDDLSVFGKKIVTGPIQYELPRTRVRHTQAFTEYIQSALPGETISVILDPMEPITIKRVAKAV